MKDKIKSALVIIGDYLFVFAVYAAITCVASIPVLIFYALFKYVIN
jgi:hypothetical protein